MDEAFDAAFDLDERAVRHEVDDLAVDLLADGVALLDAFPGVGLGLLEAEGDALALAVDFDDHDGDFFADLDDFARVADAAPGHVGDVQQAVETVEVHERAVVGDVLDDAAADDARLDLFEELATAFAALFFDEFATRDDEVLLLLVDLDDLEVEGLTHEAFKVLRRVDVDLRGGHEGVDADGDDQAALDDGLDATLDDGAFLAIGLDAFPLADLLGAVEGDGRGAVLVFKLLEVDLELHTDLDFGHVGKFSLRDEALGLAVDVDDDELVVADLGDGRGDNAVGLERAEIGFGEQFFHDAHCVLTGVLGVAKDVSRVLVVGWVFRRRFHWQVPVGRREVENKPAEGDWQAEIISPGAFLGGWAGLAPIRAAFPAPFAVSGRSQPRSGPPRTGRPPRSSPRPPRSTLGGPSRRG